jgi:NADH dehydrogenase
MLSEINLMEIHRSLQVAIQQAVTLAKNLKAELILKDPTPLYKDMGSMATIGRKKAIAEIFGLV